MPRPLAFERWASALNRSWTALPALLTVPRPNAMAISLVLRFDIAGHGNDVRRERPRHPPAQPALVAEGVVHRLLRDAGKGAQRRDLRAAVVDQPDRIHRCIERSADRDTAGRVQQRGKAMIAPDQA